MKKITKIIIGAVIGIILVFVVVNIVLYNSLKKERITLVMPEHLDYVQMVYGYSKCMEMAELSDMSIDAELKEEIRQCAEYIYEAFEDTSYDGITITELGKLAYIYTYFDFDMKTINRQVEKHYIEEECLFDASEYIGKEHIDKWYISANLDTLMDLGMSNTSVLSKYNIKEGMINWFNANIESDFNNGNDMSDYYTFMSLLYKDNMSSELNISILENALQDNIDEIYATNEAFKENIFDVSSLADVVIYEYFLGEHDEKLLREVTELYESISSREDFGYDIEDNHSILIMSYYLRGYYEAFGTINNEFLAENLDDMILEHYEKYCKGKIGK